MKKSLLLLLLALVVVNVNCQETSSPPRATTWYGVVKTSYPDYMQPHMGTPCSFQSVTYYLQGEIAFHDTVYQALYRNDGEYCAGLRWSEDGQKVYIRPTSTLMYDPWWDSSKAEHLLYDFDVQVGDVVFAFDGSYSGIDNMGTDLTTQYRWIVQDIQIVDGRKHVIVQGGQTGHLVEWIEGIGSRYILFENVYEGALSESYSTWALCAADRDGNILYSFDTDAIGIHNYNCSAKPYFPNGMKWVSYTVTCENHLQQSILKVNERVSINLKTYTKIGNIPVRVEDRHIIILYEGEEYTLYDFSLEVGDQIPIALFDNTDENEQIMMATVIATDTITLLNGLQAKRIQYDNRATDIEYIGSSTNGFFGPLSTAVPTCEPSYFCYCAIDNDVLYQTGEDICEESYQPMLMPNKTWTYAVFDNFDGHRVDFNEILLHETTTFNNLSYWVVDDDLLREDVANMRVYIIPKYMQGNTTEYLLYDFGVSQGDEISVFQPLAFYEEPYEEGNLYFLNESPAIVTEVSEEGDRRRIEVNVKSSVGDNGVTINRLTWIEGIGNINTLLGNGGDIPGIVASRSNHLLLCVSTGGELIYRTEAGETYGCDGLGTSEYQPMLTPNKTWTYVDFNSMPENDGTPHHFIEITTTETVIYNEKEYWLLDGHAMREDVAEKKVYIIPDYSNGAREEFVMYDFDVNVGNVVHNLYRVQGGMSLIYCSEADNGLYAVVTEITRDEGLLKIKVNVMCDTPFDEDFTGAYQQETWIEGVGLDYCLLYDEGKHASPPYTQHFLLCVLDDANNFSYTTTWGERMGCYLEKYDALEEVPADELLTIKGGVLTLKGVAEGTASAVFTPDGQRVMSFTGCKADISALPSGLYIIRTGTLTAKFVK